MRTPANAARAFALAATLDESLYRRWPAFDHALRSNMGGYPASTIHGGGRGGGTISDPTAQQAINPEHDRARYDASQTEIQLVQAAQLLVAVDDAITVILPRTHHVAFQRPRTTLRSADHAHELLDHIGYAIERDRHLWRDFHRIAGDTLDRSEAYADLRQAVDLLDAIYQTHCQWLEGGDPVRVHCGNRQGCPDRNPPAVDCLRCWACQRWLNRYDEERTRAAEKAAEATQSPPNGLGVGVRSTDPPDAPQAGRNDYSAPTLEGAA